jgi:hypothetical protein
LAICDTGNRVRSWLWLALVSGWNGCGMGQAEADGRETPADLAVPADPTRLRPRDSDRRLAAMMYTTVISDGFVALVGAHVAGLRRRRPTLCNTEVAAHHHFSFTVDCGACPCAPHIPRVFPEYSWVVSLTDIQNEA